ncbi:MAG: sensor histidine kinase, partial [Phycisphaerae bacterium]|nr:sensor histidine kinase [Phycisphaerae bacterium]
LTLCVCDDGCGIPGGTKEASGMGLRIMQYRAGLIGARLDIEPSPDLGGTMIRCVLPLGQMHGSR